MIWKLMMETHGNRKEHGIYFLVLKLFTVNIEKPHQIFYLALTQKFYDMELKR